MVRVRGDGRVPSTLEATALAVLALAGDAQAPLADLGATLLGGYSLLGGWGDGRTNLVAMRAVLELFKTPVPAGVSIRLLMDGKPVATGELTKDKLREVLVLEAATPGLATARTWQIIAEPAVPGLGYALSLGSYVPWPPSQPRGLELRLPSAVRGTVGKPLTLEVTAVAPAGLPLHLRYALPAGVQADPGALQLMGGLERFTVADDAVELFVPALSPGQIFTAKLRVIPTLSGTLHAGASWLTAGDGGQRFDVPPTIWTIE